MPRLPSASADPLQTSHSCHLFEIQKKIIFGSLLWKCKIHGACNENDGSTSNKLRTQRFFLTFWLGLALGATAAGTFSTVQLPKAFRGWGAFNHLTSKRASRHNRMQFLSNATSKSFPRLRCFGHFDLETHFESQQLAIFDRSSRQIATHCGYSKPSCRPSGTAKHRRNTMRCDFSTFSPKLFFFYLLALWLFPRLLLHLSVSRKFDLQISADYVIFCTFLLSPTHSLHLAEKTLKAWQLALLAPNQGSPAPWRVDEAQQPVARETQCHIHVSFSCAPLGGRKRQYFSDVSLLSGWLIPVSCCLLLVRVTLLNQCTARHIAQELHLVVHARMFPALPWPWRRCLWNRRMRRIRRVRIVIWMTKMRTMERR